MRSRHSKGMTAGLTAILGLAAALAQADVLHMPAGQTSLDRVWVTDKNNPADSTGYGAVGYVYQMGKYEVTNGQYTQFLNAKASSNDPYALYNTSMGSSTYGGITRSSSTPYTYTAKSGYENRPVGFVSWYDAIRFANWLQNGQGSGNTENGTYTITGGGPNSGNVAIPDAATRATWTPATKHWVLPSEDEWYKAAYYQPAAKGGDTDSYWLYPTRTNSRPYSDNPASLNYPVNSANYWNDDGIAGNGVNDGYAAASPYLTSVGAYSQSRSYYGTLDQGGNVYEWNEALIGTSRGMRGGGFGDQELNLRASDRRRLYPTIEDYSVGFRLASVPEPSTLALLGIGTIGLLACGWRRRKA